MGFLSHAAKMNPTCHRSSTGPWVAKATWEISTAFLSTGLHNLSPQRTEDFEDADNPFSCVCTPPSYLSLWILPRRWNREVWHITVWCYLFGLYCLSPGRGAAEDWKSIPSITWIREVLWPFVITPKLQEKSFKRFSEQHWCAQWSVACWPCVGMLTGLESRWQWPFPLY